MAKGSHTGESIAEFLEYMLVREWGLDNHRFTGTTDNAANEKKAFELLKWPSLSCQGHNINLSVKSGLGVSEINKLVGKGRCLVTFFP